MGGWVVESIFELSLRWRWSSGGYGGGKPTQRALEARASEAAGGVSGLAASTTTCIP